MTDLADPSSGFHGSSEAVEPQEGAGHVSTKIMTGGGGFLFAASLLNSALARVPAIENAVSGGGKLLPVPLLPGHGRRAVSAAQRSLYYPRPSSIRPRGTSAQYTNQAASLRTSHLPSHRSSTRALYHTVLPARCTAAGS